MIVNAVSNQSIMVSLSILKLGKTCLVFLQPGAIMNSVYHCDNVLKQLELMPDIHRLSNDDLLFQQHGVPEADPWGARGPIIRNIFLKYAF